MSAQSPPPFPAGPLIPTRENPLEGAPPTVSQPLSQRLTRFVVRVTDRSVLTCEFEAGGKLNGVGIPSALWCKRCGHSREWHDVAAAIVRLKVLEQSERLPFDGSREA